MNERRACLTEVYRNVLAREVSRCGYQIESQRDPKGRDIGFEICGIPADLIQKFSQRSKQRDQAIARFESENGRAPTDNEVAVLVRETRADRLIEIGTDQLRAQQMHRLSPSENDILSHCRSRATTLNVPLEPCAASLRHVQQHVFERLSVARYYEILTEALRHRRGRSVTSNSRESSAFKKQRARLYVTVTTLPQVQLCAGNGR